MYRKINSWPTIKGDKGGIAMTFEEAVEKVVWANELVKLGIIQQSDFPFDTFKPGEEIIRLKFSIEIAPNGCNTQFLGNVGKVTIFPYVSGFEKTKASSFVCDPRESEVLKTICTNKHVREITNRLKALILVEDRNLKCVTIIPRPSEGWSNFFELFGQ